MIVWHGRFVKTSTNTTSSFNITKMPLDLWLSLPKFADAPMLLDSFSSLAHSSNDLFVASVLAFHVFHQTVCFFEGLAAVLFEFQVSPHVRPALELHATDGTLMIPIIAVLESEVPQVVNKFGFIRAEVAFI